MSLPAGSDLKAMEQMQQSDLYQSFVGRAMAAQQKVQSIWEAKRGEGECTAGVVKSHPPNQVPGTGIEKQVHQPRNGFSGASMLATESAMTRSTGDKALEHQIMGAVKRGVAQNRLQQEAPVGHQLMNQEIDRDIVSEQVQAGGLSIFPSACERNNSSSSTGGVGGTLPRPPRPSRPARERSANSNFFKFKARSRKPIGQDGEPLPEPTDIGGFASSLKLVAGQPARVIDNEAGIKEWSEYWGIDEQATCKILELRGDIIRIVEVGSEIQRVATPSAGVVSMPFQVLEALVPRDLLLNIAWRTQSIPVPSDFAESISAMDDNTDPGAEPYVPSEAIPTMSSISNRAGAALAKVHGTKRTPAVGWQGIHDKVVRLVLDKGRSLALPPDGAIIQGRLIEALEVCGDREHRLVQRLPVDMEFRLGDGQVCDALECAAERMPAGQLAAICCTDPSLVQPGGVFDFSELAGRGELKQQGDVDEEGGPSYRVLLLFAVLGVIGEDALKVKGRDHDRLKFAKNRKDAGTQAFKAGRIRLARERYRRTANFLSVGLTIADRQEGSYTEECQGFAKELRVVCWLNAAQCELNLKNYAAAKRYCDAVIVEEPENLKALFRRGSAIMALGAEAEGLEHQAIEDFTKVLTRDQSNLQAKQMLRQAEIAQKKRDRSNKDMFKKACGDLVEEFDTIKERLERARANSNSAETVAALKDLAAGMPRLTAAKATSLRFGKCLTELQAQPPGDSAAVAELAAEIFVEVRKLILQEDLS